MKLINILLKKQYFERETLGFEKDTHITQELNTTINRAKNRNNLKIIFKITGTVIVNAEEKRKLFNAEFEYRTDYELENGEEISKEGNLREAITKLYNERVIPKLKDFFNESGMSTIDAVEF